MMYLSPEELVQNIADQSERAAAVIEHTDFTSDKFDPNAVIASFLGNIFDSALIVIALEKCSGLGDCHRHAADLVAISPKVSKDVKNFAAQIKRHREKHSLESGNTRFDADECLNFLNAYDCFMFDFLKNSETVKKMTADGTADIKFSSMRNMVEKLLRKNAVQEVSGNDSGNIAELLKENNRLLRELLTEIRKLNSK